MATACPAGATETGRWGARMEFSAPTGSAVVRLGRADGFVPAVGEPYPALTLVADESGWVQQVEGAEFPEDIGETPAGEGNALQLSLFGVSGKGRVVAQALRDGRWRDWPAFSLAATRSWLRPETVRRWAGDTGGLALQTGVAQWNRFEIAWHTFGSLFLIR